MVDVNQLLKSIISGAVKTGIKVAIALVILFISFKVINFIGKRILKSGKKKRADKTILNTAVYVGKIGAKALVAVCLVGYLGIDTSGIAALITSLGVCAGLALNGALANIAGGVLILICRPFKIDDYIEAQGVSGTVVAIQLTNTKIVTPDNKVIHIPNGTLANDTIVNYSEKDTRRVDITFAVSLSADLEKAKMLAMQIISSHPLALREPAPFVRCDHGASYETLIKCRVWTKSADYWTVYFDILESVKGAFAGNGIGVAAKQLDVNLKK